MIPPPSQTPPRACYSSRFIPLRLRVRGYHSLWRSFPTHFCSTQGYPHHIYPILLLEIRFDLIGFQSLLLTESQLLSLLPPTKTLHFGGLLHTFIQGVRSQISGSKVACTYPERFAAYRVTLRTSAKPSTIWRVTYIS